MHWNNEFIYVKPADWVHGASSSWGPTELAWSEVSWVKAARPAQSQQQWRVWPWLPNIPKRPSKSRGVPESSSAYGNRCRAVSERHPGRSACAKGGTCVELHVDTFSAQFVQTCALDQQNWNWLATFYKRSWIGSADFLKGNLMGPRCLYVCNGPFFPARERCLWGTQSLLWARCAAALKWYALPCCNYYNLYK